MSEFDVANGFVQAYGRVIGEVKRIECKACVESCDGLLEVI